MKLMNIETDRFVNLLVIRKEKKHPLNSQSSAHAQLQIT